MKNKVFMWIALVTGLILLIPLVAMQFSSEWDWQLGDFIIIGALLLGMGSLFVLTTRRIRNKTQRIIIGVLFILVLLYVWAELAVGIFTKIGS